MAAKQAVQEGLSVNQVSIGSCWNDRLLLNVFICGTHRSFANRSYPCSRILQKNRMNPEGPFGLGGGVLGFKWVPTNLPFMYQVYKKIERDQHLHVKRCPDENRRLFYLPKGHYLIDVHQPV